MAPGEAIPTGRHHLTHRSHLWCGRFLYSLICWKSLLAIAHQGKNLHLSRTHLSSRSEVHWAQGFLFGEREMNGIEVVELYEGNSYEVGGVVVTELMDAPTE